MCFCMRDDLNLDFFVEAQERDPVKMAQRDMRRPLPKRFYESVAVQACETGFGLLLDGRPVKTPARAALVLPNEALALALADEWRAQGEFVNPASMPKTRLINSALDGVALASDAVTAEIVKFAGSDLVCYRAAEPQSLVEAQNAAWGPVLDFAREELSARFICAEGVMFVAQPEASLAAVERAVAALSEGREGAIRLAALHVMTTLTGSVLIPLALVHGARDFDAAWAAAHVDEDHQMRQWGADDEALARRAARMAEMRAAFEVFETLTR